METDGAVALFSRSKEKYNLVYIKYIDNEDSKPYFAVTKAMPYWGSVFMEKECVSHIAERMGSGLGKIVCPCKGIFLFLIILLFSIHFFFSFFFCIQSYVGFILKILKLITFECEQVIKILLL